MNMGPKKRKNVCPNPLFAQWLEEWKDEAEEKGLNSKWTFSKALTSLKRYPLPLRSGKEAKILENIGDGIAKKLDKRLEDFLANGGDPSDLHKVDEEPATRKRKRKPKSNEDEFAVPKSPNMKIPRKYVPAYRSGPYALLITLYQESKKRTYVGYLTKIELQTLAQPLCDTSFILPDPGSYYTAWSSMGNLLKKGLVLKWNSPAKFHVTSTGCELAEMLLNGTADISGNSSPTGTTPSKRKKTASSSTGAREHGQGQFLELEGILHELKETSSKSSKHPKSPPSKHHHPPVEKNSPSSNFNGSSHFARLQKQLNQRNRSPTKQESSSRSTNPLISNISTEQNVLRYWYVNENNRKSSLKSNALVKIDETIGLGFLIKINRVDLESSKFLYKVDTDRTAEDVHVFAYLADKDALELAPSPLMTDSGSPSKPICIESLPSSSTSKYTSATPTKMTEDPGHITNQVSSKVDRCISQKDPSHTGSMQTNPNIQDIDVKKPDTFLENVPSLKTTTSFDLANKPAEKLCDFLIGKNIQPKFSLYPETFEIVLLVDVVETSGSGKRKKEMADNLLKIGVTMEVRKLQLGDFLWVAREKFGEKREVVLDFVVERKRMDDLASSIIDGRFKEQKFRLKSCGLKKLIYLVEKYGSVEHFVVPEATLRQAIMNTQVVDGLFVKETNSIQDSVKYLEILTNQLKQLYNDKLIHCLPMNDMKELKGNVAFDEIILKEEQHLPQFDEFSTQTIKNKVLTVKELFCKQLMQIKGVSVDRAIAIADKYPTPACLVDAFNQPSHEEDKCDLLTNITFGKTKRKIGAAISKQICLHYTTLRIPSQ